MTENRPRNIVDPCPGHHCLNGAIETFPGDFHQLLCLGIHLSHGPGDGGVGKIAAQVDAAVYAHDIAFFQFAFVGNPVDHHLIDRETERGGKPLVVEEGRPALVPQDKLPGDPVEIEQGGAGDDEGAHMREEF